MVPTTVPTNTPNDQRLALLRLADEMSDDRYFAHAALAATLGLHEGTERDDDEKGVIQLIDMLARRLGTRCKQLREIRGGETTAVPSRRRSAVEVVATPHPDADLQAAWESWLATMRSRHAERLSDDEFEQAIVRAENAITALPATTAARVAIKLKLALHGHAEMRLVDEADFIVDGKPSDILLGDPRQKLIWQGIEALESMVGRASA